MPPNAEIPLPPFRLSQADTRPMYVQIVENIKQLVITGHWSPGMSMPSIREFAVSLNVSVITVKRAYQELESAGIIFTRHGKGSFVAEQIELVSQAKQQELSEQLESIAELALLLSISEQELIEKLKIIYAQKSGKSSS